jgi:hypothetical protein
MIATTAGLPSRTAVHSSLVVMRRSFLISAHKPVVFAGRSVASGPVSSVLFSPFFDDEPSLWGNIHVTTHAAQTSMNIGLEPSALCLVRNSTTFRHFTLLLCWSHVTDWSTDDAGGAGWWVTQETVPGFVFERNRKQAFLLYRSSCSFI